MSFSRSDVEMLGKPTEPLNLTMYLADILRQFNFDENMTSEILALSPEQRQQFLEDLQLPSPVQEADVMNVFEYRVHKAISLYVPPFLLLMGTFGNVIAFIILRNKAMSRQSTNLYLAALALADSLVLFVGLFRRWMGDVLGVDIQSETAWLCKTVSVLALSGSQFSVWLIIAVTIERYIVVSHPLHASRYCNPSRAKRVIALIASIFLSLNIHFAWTMTTHEKSNGFKECIPTKSFHYLVVTIWPWIDATLYALLPFLLIVIFNTLIIFQTLKATIWRDAAQNGPFKQSDKRKYFSDTNIKLTVMLLAVSFTFLITTFPMAIVMVYHSQWNGNTENASIPVLAQRQLIRTSSEMLMFLNHSVNFYLYCALGQKFRNHVMKKLCRKNASTSTNLSDHSQHLYCSRVNGYHVASKTMCHDETAL
ncbi:probable G-protein coupled receptor 139 [Dreissena polymorpha]|uniref:G-protein coupled receptors family 1 profile domain-containing protein n=1 Tax=Dreissena polymorpha TaxID=45954 RepID=A0A9D4IEJ4_DREPO|nr:probable G-protein coupled receptor 139 [Dreissena polymorpha]KAH3772461.1 hypothetical protein DPMN_173799 [Dreissena polymorpha]